MLRRVFEVTFGRLMAAYLPYAVDDPTLLSNDSPQGHPSYPALTKFRQFRVDDILKPVFDHFYGHGGKNGGK